MYYSAQNACSTPKLVCEENALYRTSHAIQLNPYLPLYLSASRYISIRSIISQYISSVLIQEAAFSLNV